MNQFQLQFLELYKNAASGRPASDPGFSEKEWTDLFHVAHMQEILPLLYDACYSLDSFKHVSPDARRTWKERALSAAVRQITQTNEFLTILLHAQSQGLDPIVLKGIVCRSLYPQPSLRPSVDEDILILPEEVRDYHNFFSGEGLFEDSLNESNSSEWQDLLDAKSELSYHKENSPTYIEVHKTLFVADSEVFGDFNSLFSGIQERAIRVQIEDVSVRTPAPTDHLLYLILHAFKHFVYSGIGIRAVCDIGLFAKLYAGEIDWERIRQCLEEVHAFAFARALLRILQLYLLPDAGFFDLVSGANAPCDWHLDELDVEPLLDDILAGGVHGNASLERLHSSNITLNAVAQEKKADRSGSKVPSRVTPGFVRSAFHAVFLPLKKMIIRYPYLKKAPFLLPVAWVQRIIKYLKERISARAVNHSARVANQNSAAESVRLGNSRVELLKKYGVIR